jgi:tetratricopeptide (TPR) repeat protein
LQLIKTGEEGHAWANEYDRNWKDIFSVQSEVAETIANEIKAIITPDEEQLIRKVPTASLTAYDFYQRGRNELDTKDDSVSWEKAQKLFKKALELDSTFALAYTGLADIYWSKYYWKTFLSENFLDSVIILTSKSLAFDNQCAEAYYLRGAGYLNIDRISEAFEELDKAIQFNPNNWKAYSTRSFILSGIFHDFVGAISNKKEAILRNRGSGLPGLLSDLGGSFGDIGFPELGKKYFQQALELTGDSTAYLYRLRWLENSLGNFEKAYQLAKTIYKRDPNRVSSDIAIYCSGVGHDQEAIDYFEKQKKQWEKSGEIDLYASKEIAYSLWQVGRIEEAKYYFDQQIIIGLESIKLRRWNSFQKGAHFDLAEVYAFLGDKEKAYYYLDEVNKNKSFSLWWVTLFKYHPLLAPLRQEPRFQKILKDVEGKYQAEHERVREWLVEEGMM